ncbi:tryptophan-rich sensory protein [soil metagenome]
MQLLIDRPNTTALVLNISIAIGLCLAINSVIFGFGFDTTENDVAVWFAPPGYVVGAMWVLLFALIGLSRYLLNASGDFAAGTKVWTVGLLLFCLAYPIYTIGFQSEIIGLIGNIATIGLTIYVMSRTLKFSRAATFLLAPIVVWVSFASLIILAELRWI